MVVKMAGLGRSFGGVADYCLHDRWVPGQEHPESAERVEWTETRNLATGQGERAARIMAATAEAGPDLKRLAGVAATGRKLEKPVCHYSLNWAKDEKPGRPEMKRAALESLKALGLEEHQALLVSHRDGQPHVHVIVNRVDPESGKAAGLSRSQLRLSKWAERYEQGQGEIRCPKRVRNNAQRVHGKRVVDGRGRSGGRWRREQMSPQGEPREVIAADRDRFQRERVAWHRAEERTHWARLQGRRAQALGELESQTKREWSALYGRQERQRKLQAEGSRRVLGRLRQWRELGGGLREITGAIRGRTEVLRRFRAELEGRQRRERIVLGKAHSEAVREIERKEGETYRNGMEGSEERAWRAARTNGRSTVYNLPIDRYSRLSVWEERMELVRELDGEQAYEKMCRAVERASQPVETLSHVPSRSGPDRDGPERGGPERDYGPSR